MWYDFIVYFAIMLGVLFLIWGSFEHRKFVWGLILIIGAGIVKAFIWIISMTSIPKN